MNEVHTIDWMLDHKGIAVAKPVNGDKNIIEIIKYSENEEEYPALKEYAKSSGYILVVGKNTDKDNRLGLF